MWEGRGYPGFSSWLLLLLIYRPRKDERLSWPSWLTCSGRFTHIVVTRRLQAECRTGSVCRPKTCVPPTVLRYKLLVTEANIWVTCQLLNCDFDTILYAAQCTIMNVDIFNTFCSVDSLVSPWISCSCFMMQCWYNWWQVHTTLARIHRIDELLSQQNHLQSQLIQLKTLLSSESTAKIAGNNITLLYIWIFIRQCQTATTVHTKTNTAR